MLESWTLLLLTIVAGCAAAVACLVRAEEGQVPRQPVVLLVRGPADAPVRPVQGEAAVLQQTTAFTPLTGDGTLSKAARMPLITTW